MNTFYTGLVNTLLFCCFTLLDSYEKYQNEIVCLKGILKYNGYSIAFYIRWSFDKVYVTKKSMIVRNKNNYYYSCCFYVSCPTMSESDYKLA